MERMPWMSKMKHTFRSVANTIQFHTKRRLKKGVGCNGCVDDGNIGKSSSFQGGAS